MNYSDFHMAVGVVSWLAWPVLLALSLFSLSVPDQTIEQNVRERARFMIKLGLLHVGLAFAFACLAVTVIATYPEVSWNESKESVAIFGLIPLVCDAGFTSFVGLVLLIQGRELRQHRDDLLNHLARVSDSCRSGKHGVWAIQALVLLGAACFFPPLFLVVFLVGGAWLPLSLLVGNTRSASQLLLALSIAIKHGRPLAPELDAFASGCRSAMRSRLRRLVNHLEDGCSLGEALQLSPGLMPRWMVAAICTAEETGTLDSTLQRLIKQQSELLINDHTRASYAGWLTYGIGYSSVASLVVGFLMIFIVPKYKAIFQGFGTELPSITMFVVQLADVFAQFWFVLSPCVLFGGYVLLELMRAETSGGKSLRLPGLHRLYLALDTPDVLRQLSTAVKNGRLLPEALQAIGRFHFRRSVAQALTQVASAAERGADAFEELHARNFLTASDLKLLATSQQAGNLDWALSELAEIRERRLYYRQRLLFEFLRPIPVMVGGVVMLIIAVAFFMPIVKLINDLT